jgi:hypothetical protein
MPELGKGLKGIVHRSIIRIVQDANKTQIDVDDYLGGVEEYATSDSARALLTETSVMGNYLDAYRNHVGRILDETLNEAAGEGMHDYHEENGNMEELCTWRTQSGKPCPDCAGRDGQTRSRLEWELAGMPGSGFSVCGGNCKCIIDAQGEGHFNYKRSE